MFQFTPAKEKCQGTSPITLSDLALHMGVTEDQVVALKKHGWLRVIEDHENPSVCVVGKPEPMALLWLKQVLGPLAMIPMVPMHHVQTMLECTDLTLRKLIADYGIVIHIDPALGALMTVASFHKLFNALYPWHERVRFDRAMFFSILCGIDPGEGNTFSRPLEYSEILENELARVARLKEPQRTIRATEIYTAYRDAKKVSEVVRGVPQTPMQQRVANIMAYQKRRLERLNQDIPRSPRPDRKPPAQS